MVAHFDYYNSKGDYDNGKGVLLIPRTICGYSKMNNDNTTTGGYIATITHVTTCPAIASALSTVLGSYLLSNRILLSNTMNASTPSMAGANWQGASTGWAWTASQCDSPNEVQIYGSMIFSSDFYDVGEACEKLAVFNFINHVEYSRMHFWLRSVVSSATFARAYGDGSVNHDNASSSHALRPLIYIG